MHAAFSADSLRIATASCDKTAKIWDVATGEELLTIRGHDDRVIAVAFSPNGKLLATASWDNTAKVWDAATGTEIETLRGHSGAVCCVSFSPDGKRLASGGHIKRRRSENLGHDVLKQSSRWEA
jgi:WD40 repeat protein